MFPGLLTVTTNPHIQLVFYFPPMSWPLFRPQPSLTLFKESLSKEVPQPLVFAFVFFVCLFVCFKSFKTPPPFYRKVNFLKGTFDSVTLLLTTVNGLSYVQMVFRLLCAVHRMLPLKPMCLCAWLHFLHSLPQRPPITVNSLQFPCDTRLTITSTTCITSLLWQTKPGLRHSVSTSLFHTMWWH